MLIGFNEKNGILFCRSRIIDGQRFLKTGGFDEESIGNEIGLNLLTPLIDRHSAIALSIAQYIHHEVAEHSGFETCYRTSLTYCHIIQGPGLFKELGEQCVKCHKIRRKYLEVSFGPVADHQLAMVPAFHTAFVDIDGPYTTYVPGFERNTRNRKSLAAKNYILTFCCPVTKLINLQVIEGKSAQSVCEGLSRLGCEVGFPQHLVLDRETSFMKVINDAEINLQDLSLKSFKEYGIKCTISPVAAHNFSGLVERKIKTVQECFVKIDIQNSRLTATGLQTMCKLVENKINNIPFGYSFAKDATNTPLLRILTPNMMRIGRLNSRSLDGPVRFPRGPKEIMSKVESLYEAFFKVWNVVMVPRLIPSPKWFKSSEEIKIDDVVYFQKLENDISSDWTLGQVDSVVRGKDGQIRRVTVRYCNITEGVARYTERSVRSLVRLFHVEDDYFTRDLDLAEKLLTSLNEQDDRRVQPLRLHRDNDGNYSVCDHDHKLRSCVCCCPGHCNMSSHSHTGRVNGVTLAHLVNTDADDKLYMYEKELVKEEDVTIAAQLTLDADDQMFAMMTALETDFTL